MLYIVPFSHTNLNMIFTSSLRLTNQVSKLSQELMFNVIMQGTIDYFIYKSPNSSYQLEHVLIPGTHPSLPFLWSTNQVKMSLTTSSITRAY